MKAYLATTNEGKLRELRAILAGSGLEIDVYPGYREVEETAADYAGNALLKASGLWNQIRAAEHDAAAVLADDSGIEVQALGGGPGVLSARYAGDVTWPQRRARLLAEMDGMPDDRRGARFVCVIVLIAPDGRRYEGQGEVRGLVAHREVGSHGFGYDPIFYYPPLQKTFGQISEEEKNRLSHRYHAARSLLVALSAP